MYLIQWFMSGVGFILLILFERNGFCIQQGLEQGLPGRQPDKQMHDGLDLYSYVVAVNSIVV